VGAFVYRDINWRINRGDVVGHYGMGGFSPIASAAATGKKTDLMTIPSSSSTIWRTIGTRVPRWRIDITSASRPMIKVRTAFTNPIHFTSKDSFARGANRTINRFHWVPDWTGGTFPITAASVVNTGASTSFYYGWTTATTQFIAVKAIDNAGAEASAVSVIGVVIQTESTFRFPDDIRDSVESISDGRDRGFSFDPAVGVDYGFLDIGSIGPRVLTIKGYAATESSTTDELIDIERISRVFQQRYRVYVVTPTSAATAIQGYVLEAPIIQDVSAPAHKKWSVRVGTLRP